jgi:hypothetical protein
VKVDNTRQVFERAIARHDIGVFEISSRKYKRIGHREAILNRQVRTRQCDLGREFNYLCSIQDRDR